MKTVFRNLFKIFLALVLLMGCISRKEQENRNVTKNQTEASLSVFHHKGILDVQYLGNGQALSIGRDSLIIRWDIDSGRVVKVKKMPRVPLQLAFDLNSSEWWTVCKGGVLYDISPNDLRIKKTISTVLPNISQLEFSKPLGLFWGKGGKGLFRFNSKESNIQIVPGIFPEEAVIALHAVQPVMAIFSGNAVSLHDARTLRKIGRLALPGYKAEKENFRRLAFVGKDHILITYNDHIWLGDWQKRIVKKLPESHLAPITALAASDDGTLAATGSMDKSVKLWKIPDGELQASLYGHFLTITSLAFADSSRKLISASEDGNLLVWDLEKKEQEKRLGSLDIALKNPWKLTVKRVKYARSFKVGSEEYNVSDSKNKLLKVYAEVKNTGLADNMFFSSNLFLIAPDQSRYHCMGLENYVALSPKAYFKRLIAPNKSIKGNFIFVIPPPYKEYSITYETLSPIPLKNF